MPQQKSTLYQQQVLSGSKEGVYITCNMSRERGPAAVAAAKERGEEQTFLLEGGMIGTAQEHRENLEAYLAELLSTHFLRIIIDNEHLAWEDAVHFMDTINVLTKTGQIQEGSDYEIITTAQLIAEHIRLGYSVFDVY